MSAKRWTITNECGDVLASFATAEEAWAALTNNKVLNILDDRFEEETGDFVMEFRVCCDGIEVVLH